MPDNFGDIWRRVRLHCPAAPFALVKDWTQQAYKRLHDRRPWVWSMRETRLSIEAARSLTGVFVQGSRLIQSTAGFVAGDAGRQIRVGTYPVYTIVSVEDASNATLDLAYAGTGGSLTAQILSAYQTLPADFGAFMLVVDPTVQRQIAWWYTQDQLARIDPLRVSSGTPQRALIATTDSPALATLGQARSEWWPYPLTAVQYPAWYRAKPLALLDADLLQGVLATRGDILEAGALARCARWPGTAEAKNPYFNIQLAKELADQFDKECATLELRDDDQAQQSWVALPYHQWPAWGLSGSTEVLRASDATVGDYLGGSNSGFGSYY